MDEIERAALEPEIFRDKYPQSKRDKMDASDFCGPNQSFPVMDAEDVLHASERLHNASGDQSSIKACVIGKAKANGWPLPSTWTDKKEDRAMPEPTSLDLYLPISRIDKEKREVTVTATAERLDGHGTVIGFEGSQEAFGNWRGNVREMHDPTKAVGRAIVIDPHPDTKEVDVTLRVSKGAEDTWQKVLDGTLTGASIGAKNGKWSRRKVGSEEVPFLERYELVELSLVDNPSCPGCDIKIVRNNEITEVLDDTEETPAIERVGKSISAMTGGKIHEGISHALMAARSLMQTHADAGCDQCKAALAHLDPDNDGDIDAYGGSYGDTDGDAGDMDDDDHKSRAIEAEIQRHMQPLLQRMNATLAGFAARPHTIQPTPAPQNDEAITRLIEAMETRYHTELSKVLAVLTGVEDTVKRIAATPLPGGPVATPVPMDKRLATSPGAAYSATDEIAAIQRVQSLGLLKDQDSQVAAAARLIALTTPGR